MGFQNLRNNNTVYILHKEPHIQLEVGKVINVTPPVPKYGGQFTEFVVDLSLEVNKSTINFQKVPANLDITDVNTSTVITCNKLALEDEVKFTKQKSEDVISSMEQHQQIVMECDDILKKLNPEIAEKEARDKETQALKEEIKSLKEMFTEITKHLKQ